MLPPPQAILETRYAGACPHRQRRGTGSWCSSHTSSQGSRCWCISARWVHSWCTSSPHSREAVGVKTTKFLSFFQAYTHIVFIIFKCQLHLFWYHGEPHVTGNKKFLKINFTPLLGEGHRLLVIRCLHTAPPLIISRPKAVRAIDCSKLYFAGPLACVDCFDHPKYVWWIFGNFWGEKRPLVPCRFFYILVAQPVCAVWCEASSTHHWRLCDRGQKELSLKVKFQGRTCMHSF